MTGFGKFLVGAAVTTLLAWGAHEMSGSAYLERLQAEGATALAADGGRGEVAFAMASSPQSRTAVVEGEWSDAERETIRNRLMAIDGIAGVRFAAAGDGAGDGVAAEPDAGADAEEVASCQGDLDALMADKVITFRSGSAYMPESSLAVVDEVAAALKDCEGMAIAVGGHTDATGSDEVNLSISQARADAVAAALAERGIAAERVSATGYGSSRPKVEGDGANEANRRIEFTLGGAPAGDDAAVEGGE